ncbi:hypothetical protein G9P44_002915 [Scheffersomyces stipitis]|nr:hypothetical protein G9P44_002915 [Scheffersomyces stipitis]
MASTISYANVAAKGTSSEASKAAVPIAASASSASSIVISSTETVEEPASTASTSSTVEVSATVTGDSEPSTASNSATSTPSTSAGSTPNASKKEKKSLAPAPVPLKSAWSTTSLASDSSVVDEHKWPTPDKIENQPTSKNNQQKFIKPITKQWLPMNAKVVLPNTRNNNQKQTRNRKKNANGSTNKNASSNQSGSPDSGANAKKQNGANGSVKKDEVAAHDAEEVASNGEESAVEVPDNAGDFDVNNINNQYQQFNPQFQKFGQVNVNNQKNFRRFNNPINNNNNTTTNNNGQFNNKRYSQQPQPQGLPQNGFYHPQPFIQNQNFQTFQNRPYRPQNGQFRPNNRNYRQQNNGYRNGGMVMPPHMGHFVPVAIAPVQIPPPISPKQDPEQALTQQIDYYFSLENLLRDIFLRKNMDSEGWIALDLILNFKRVKIIINGIQNSLENVQEFDGSIILESIKKCENLEIQYINDKTAENAAIDDVKLRVKGNYEQWLLSSEN